MGSATCRVPGRSASVSLMREAVAIGGPLDGQTFKVTGKELLVPNARILSHVPLRVEHLPPTRYVLEHTEDGTPQYVLAA